MTGPGVGYDEIGSRTRQAWLRTGLGVVAVTLLTVRGLVVAGAGVVAVVVALAPAATFLGVAALRSARLQHGASAPMAGRTALWVILALLGLAVVGVGGAALAWGGR